MTPLPPWAWAWPASALGPSGEAREGLHQESPWRDAPWAEAWERLHDQALALGFCEWAPVAGQGPEAYRSRLLPLHGAPALLVGIRFRGGRLDWPFVDLWPREGALRSPSDWAEALALVATAFAPFQPRACRVHHALGAPPPVAGAWVDQGHWVALAAEVAASGPLPPGLVLKPAVDLAWYPLAQAAHARFQATQGPWAKQVRLESEADLGEALKQGALVLAEWEGEWAGLAAALPEAWLGQPGWLMAEELVRPDLAGRGMGRALQRALASRLPAAACLWGTILSANAPSQAVARACGRREVGRSSFLPLL